MTLNTLVLWVLQMIVQPLAWIIITLAAVFFMWNIFKIIANRDSAEALTKLKTQTFWGVIALFVMTSVWGLVAWLTNTFLGTAPFIPQLETNPQRIDNVLMR